MPRRRTGGKRGRPRQPHARRRETTRRGRAGLSPLVDHGSLRLRARKLALTTRADVELTPAGVLYGRGHLDNAQYSTLAGVTAILRNIKKAMGQGSLSVTALWSALLNRSHAPATRLPLFGDTGARRSLTNICRRLDGCRGLVLELAEERTVPPIVIRVLEHRLDAGDQEALEALRKGLDGLTVRLRDEE